MEASTRDEAGKADLFAAAPFVARYAPVFWEPLPGTGERVVALVAVEPHEATTQAIAAASYVVIGPERLRAMLGRQRGQAAQGVLRQAAAFMTTRQRAGISIDELRSPFHGLDVGNAFIARAQTVEQLLDAAVRSVTAFGSADELIEEQEAEAAPRHTVRTSSFLGQLRRLMTAGDREAKSRFEKRLHLPGDVPEVTIDYAFERWFVQVTSLPATARQSMNAQREAQSKLFELELVRKAMDGNPLSPVLLVNCDALEGVPSSEAIQEARQMQERLTQLARSCDALLLEAPSAGSGVELILNLHEPPRRRAERLPVFAR